MDERRTLAIMAWAVGSVVGIMFILNGIALSIVESPSAAAAKQIAVRNAPALPSSGLSSMRGG